MDGWIAELNLTVLVFVEWEAMKTDGISEQLSDIEKMTTMEHDQLNVVFKTVTGQNSTQNPP